MKMSMKIKNAHAEFCQYQETIKNFKPATIRGYKDTLHSFFLALPEVEEMEQVSFLVAQRFFFWGRSERDWTPATFITHHKRMNVFFKWANDARIVNENPFAEIEKPKLEQRLPTRLSKEEAMTIIETAASLNYTYPFLRCRNHAIFATFLYCGLRKNELLRLKMSDVDLSNAVIYIHQGKGNKDRVVPIPYSLQRILERYIQDRERLDKTAPYFFVSLNRDRGFTQSGLKRVVNKVRKRTGIHFYVHMLRHTFATLMIEGGCDIYSLSKMLGHNDIKTTTIYLSASVEHLRGQIMKHPLNNY